MSEYYLTKPRRVRIIQWNDANEPPEGVHDTFYNPQRGTMAGYINTPSGDRIIHTGQYVATYLDADEHEILEYRDVVERFVKVVE